MSVAAAALGALVSVGAALAVGTAVGRAVAAATVPAAGLTEVAGAPTWSWSLTTRDAVAWAIVGWLTAVVAGGAALGVVLVALAAPGAAAAAGGAALTGAAGVAFIGASARARVVRVALGRGHLIVSLPFAAPRAVPFAQLGPPEVDAAELRSGALVIPLRGAPPELVEDLRAAVALAATR